MWCVCVCVGRLWCGVYVEGEGEEGCQHSEIQEEKTSLEGSILEFH